MSFRHSIRWRLQLWHGLVLLAVLAVFGYSAHRLMADLRLREIDRELQLRMTVLAGMAAPGPGGMGMGPGMMAGRGGFRLSPEDQDLFSDVERVGYYYVVWSQDGKIVSSSAGAPVDVPALDPAVRSGPGLLRIRGVQRELAMVIQRPVPPQPRFRAVNRTLFVVVGCSVEEELNELTQLAWWLAGAGGGVWVLGLGVGWWLTSRTIQPIREIGATAARIAAGNYSERIDVRDAGSELGELATGLNETFSRLQAALERQIQFTADASHELRTPTFVILAQAQAALRREREGAEYREGFEVCQRAAQQMRETIEALLLLVRHDAGRPVEAKEACRVDQLAAEVVRLLQPLAAEAGVSLQAEVAEPAVVAGEPGQLRSLLTNLLANAIEYNRPGGVAKVRVAQTGKSVGVVVSDTGRGIAASDLPRVFERFFRADPSRSSSHSGLGLAICRSVVAAHGGTIEVASDGVSGTTFSVSLPGVDGGGTGA